MTKIRVKSTSFNDNKWYDVEGEVIGRWSIHKILNSYRVCLLSIGIMLAEFPTKEKANTAIMRIDFISSEYNLANMASVPTATQEAIKLIIKAYQ